MTVAAFGLTDVGRKRRINEDSYLMDVERGLFVVADGMGGHAAGEVASRITVESIQEFIAGTEDEHENTWPFGFNNRYSLEGNRLTTSVEKANEKVMRAVQNRPELKGMGTTVVAALFDEVRATLVHVGDSRAYLLRDGELKRLTDDHSWVQEQVNAGILSEEEAKTHPLKNVVTRALGGAAHVAVDLIEIPTLAGDRYILCSDGLTGMVSDEELFEHLRAPVPIERTVRALIDLANEHGGIDNVTAILIEVTGDGDVPHRRAADPTAPTAILGQTAPDELPTLPGIEKPPAVQAVIAASAPPPAPTPVPPASAPPPPVLSAPAPAAAPAVPPAAAAPVPAASSTPSAAAPPPAVAPPVPGSAPSTVPAPPDKADPESKEAPETKP